MIPIKGLQKTTLVDYPHTIACTVFLGGCNFRCGYCYNLDLVLNSRKLPSIPEEDFFSFLDSRKGLLEGVCITGGEPTLWEDLPSFCAKIKDKGFKVKLDTNGTHPEMLRLLIDKKLVDYVAMDVKAPLEEYQRVIGVAIATEHIAESIRILLEGNVDYEFRTTMVPDTIGVAEILKIGALIKGAKRYFLQQFRPMETTIDPKYRTMEPLPPSALLDMQTLARQYVSEVGIRNAS
ncbi:MAG: anaerobic ribonucleoside-triphosphate reductase activating protein [Nanoarchaeota archaeon]|nr:anaerobic ribonucleoside-triphosphate reductase activating protein [Nanoarchaeota archaeon]